MEVTKKEIIKKFIETCDRNGKPYRCDITVSRAVEELEEALDELGVD